MRCSDWSSDVCSSYLALLASYSLHYVGGVRGLAISADYYGRFPEHILELSGLEHQDPPFIPIMANGTSGDINNINFKVPRARKEPYEQMNYVARDEIGGASCRDRGGQNV